MQLDEGYIKFNIDWKERDLTLNQETFITLNTCRNKLFNLELIGAYDNGIGFGNISKRFTENKFIITGSATGNISELQSQHYSLVEEYKLNENYVKCIGKTKASSESLSHAIIYETLPKVNAIIHTHNLKMWNRYFNDLPTTSKKAEFGTPDMALEIKKLLNSNSGIIIMGGHEEGILCYGETLKDAEKILISYFNKV